MQISDYEYQTLRGQFNAVVQGVAATQTQLGALDAKLTLLGNMLHTHDRELDKLQAVVWVLTKLVAAQSGVTAEELTSAIETAMKETCPNRL